MENFERRRFRAENGCVYEADSARNFFNYLYWNFRSGFLRKEDFWGVRAWGNWEGISLREELQLVRFFRKLFSE